MNCVIERRRAEELLDSSRSMPFGFSMNAEPKKRVTGERMAIFCESGSAIKWVVFFSLSIYVYKRFSAVIWKYQTFSKCKKVKSWQRRK